MTPDEFEELLAAFFDGKGKRASLRARVIRLAYTRPDLRLPLVRLVLEVDRKGS